MPWFLVAIFAGALIATLLLAPKAKVQHAKPQSFDDMNFPKASEGDPINLVLGRRLVKGPNTIWVGNFRSVAIVKKQKTGLFSSKKVTVGFTYYVGLDMALGIGPLTMHNIYCDKDIIWTGNASTDGGTVSINKPNLFGGAEKGGGFVASCRFYTGSWTQGVNSYVEGFVGPGKLPAYRGTAHLVFQNANIGESAQLRALHFEVSRYPNNLGLSGGKHRVGDDCNPMEAIYTLSIEGWGGLDLDPALINVANWIDVGNTLHDEGIGVSLNIASPNEGGEVINEIMQQIDAVFYQDPVTGMMNVRLVRLDYNIADLPVYDESNITGVRAFTSKQWDATFNNVRVKYTNRAKKYSDAMASAQDLASISAQERVRSTEISYPFCTTGLLAATIAARDLAQMSVPTMSASIEMNREGQTLKPGDVFIWRWKEYQLRQVIMRVKSVDLGALNDNKLAFEVSQDSFAVGQTLFGAPESSGSGIIKPNTPATAITSSMLHEGAYFFAQASDMSLGDQQSLLVYAAEPSAASDEFDIWTSNDTVNYGESETGAAYTPTGTLSAAITASTSLATGIIPSITIATTSDEIVSVAAAQITEGYGMFYIDAELFAHEGVTDNGNGTLTLSNVRRSLLDTTPQAHASGADVWFIIGDNIIEDAFGWDDTVRVKALPITFVDTLDLDDAPYSQVVMKRRAQRPLRPALVKFDGGGAFVPPSVGTGSKTITWVNRNRLAPSILSIADVTNEWETGQQTVIRWKVTVSGAWQQHLAGPGDTSFTFNAGATSGQTVYYEVYSTRSGLDSFSKWEFTSGASSATGTNPDAGGADPSDDNDEYTPPESASSVPVLTSEAIPANRMVNIYNDAGTAKARLASSTGKYPAHGFTREAYASGVTAIIYTDGMDANFAGMTAGTQWLGANGAVTATAPSASGSISQTVGVASSATVFTFEQGEPVELK